jgi:outer membrane protein
MPTKDPHFEHNYAAGGVNLNIPLFAGGLYRSRQRQAELQADAADAALQDRISLVVRDVRLAWLEAGHARERIGLTKSLLDNANAALALAQARFDQGLSSTVELTQAELAKTSAEIANTTADFSYRVRRDILDYQTGSLR